MGQPWLEELGQCSSYLSGKMVRKLRAGLIQIRGWLVSFYLLIDEDEVFIVDGGFIGDLLQIDSALKQEGLNWENLKGILMTHGHLDHTYNVGKILKKKKVPVYGHPADKQHFAGGHRYSGIARICGLLEFAGRKLLGFDSVTLDHEIADGDVLDIWSGLQVIHTPGHTEGHCSYYSPGKKILFSGDLFANWKYRTMLPWPWLNSCPDKFPESIGKVLELSPDGILANHCDRADAELQRKRFFGRFKVKYG